MIQRKICMVGAFAVGKTSLVQRFVHSLYSDKYHTTIGVKVDRKEVSLASSQVNLLLWDLAGEDDFQAIRPSYLRGSSGLLFVADGTRAATVDLVSSLRTATQEHLGRVPHALAINKVDLESEWDITEHMLEALRDAGWEVFLTSAKTGERVAEAFHWLAQRTLDS